MRLLISYIQILLPVLFLYTSLLYIRVLYGSIDLEIDLFIRQRIFLNEQINRLLPDIEQSALLAGILLGEKRDLPPLLHLALRDTSTLHMIVVSGQNLTMLAGVFMSLAGIFHRRVVIVISLCAILVYTLLTGAQVPVIRAAIMVALSSLAVVLGRQKDSVWILMLTGGCMLLVNPWWFFDLSFQLSFLGTWGVIIVAPIIQKSLSVIPPFFKQDLAVCIGAQLMVMPLIAQVFHQVSLVGIFTNVLVSWTIPFIMILGGIMLIVSFVSVTIAQVVAMTVELLLTYFITIVNWFSTIPFAWEYVSEKSWIFWIGYYLIMASVLLFITQKVSTD